jgi:hypothetical protein
MTTGAIAVIVPVTGLDAHRLLRMSTQRRLGVIAAMPRPHALRASVAGRVLLSDREDTVATAPLNLSASAEHRFGAFL